MNESIDNIFFFTDLEDRYIVAIYFNDFIDAEDYFSDIYVKTNILDQLERQISSSNWKKEIVNVETN